MDMEGAMPVYVIETTYHLPVYRQRLYEEGSRGAASGETYGAGIWEGAERAYQGTALPIPASFHETVQYEAELFNELRALVREPVRPMGLSREEFERWLPKALATIEKADAIQNGR